MTEKLKKYLPETVAMVLWLAGVITVSVFHEPWFDEIQAWQIAKTATWHNLFFEVPHSECHPILWHLIMRPFAMAGAPFEPTIKAINIIITGIATALLIFKAPLPRAFRLYIPFTFMIFYQTACVNRCYCLLYLEFVLLAMARRIRSEKPMPFIIVVAFMCFTHVVGMMFGGLLCVLWVIDIIKEYTSDKSKGNILKDKRVITLTLLLIWAVLIMLMIAPSSKNTNFESSYLPTDMGRLKTIVFDFFSIPYESTFSMLITASPVIIYVITFAIINLILIYYCKRRKCLAEFLLPYLVFSVFYAFVWNLEHMLQFYYYFLIYIFFSFNDKAEFNFKGLLGRLKDEWVKKLISCVAVLALMTMPVSAVITSYHDIKGCYYPARDIANFIKEHHMENLRIFTEWDVDREITDKNNGNINERKSNMDTGNVDEYDDINIFLNGYAYTLDAYFDKHIVDNNYYSDQGIYYATYRKRDINAIKDYYEKLSKEPYPEVIVGSIAGLGDIYGEEEAKKYHFKLVERVKYEFFWKGNSWGDGYMAVWVREDLLDKYGLEAKPMDYNIEI